MGANLSTAASAAITFVITLVLNTAINFYSSERGQVSISQPVELRGQLFVIVSIENHSLDFIESIGIEIPKTSKLEELATDSPIKIETAANSTAAATQAITVGRIPPKSIARIFIPLPMSSEVKKVRMLNEKATGLKLVAENDLESPIKLAVISAALSALCYAIFFAIVRHQQKRDNKQLEDKSIELKKDIDSAKIEGKTIADELTLEKQSLRKEVAEVRQLLVKQRILLMARLSDYARELDFWRNTIRQLAIERGSSPIEPDSLIKHVTKCLKTYSTNASAPDFDSVRVAAAWLSEDTQPRTK